MQVFAHVKRTYVKRTYVFLLFNLPIKEKKFKSISLFIELAKLNHGYVFPNRNFAAGNTAKHL